MFLFLDCTYSSENNKIEQIELKDPVVVELIDKYVNSHEFFHDPEINPVLLLKCERKGDDRIVYIGSSFLMGAFKGNVPSKFFKVGEGIGFLYEQNNIDTLGCFASFYEGFKDYLHRDVLPNGKINPDYVPAYFVDPEVWRVVIRNNRIFKIQNVSKFPSKSFSQQFTYDDDDGRLIYLDGIYADADIPPEPPIQFSLANYLKHFTSLKIEHNLDVTLTFVIDEKGKAVDVKVEGVDDEEIKGEIIEAIKRMPRWTPGKINEKPVKVRDSYGLKEL